MILIKINFAKGNGKINRTNVGDVLNAFCKEKFYNLEDVSGKSISRWVKDSFIEKGQLSLETDDGRHSTAKDDVIYLIIKYGHAEVTSKELADLLIQEGDGYQLQQDISLLQIVIYIGNLLLKYAKFNLK